MALPKLFQRIFWHNNTTPAINEDNLNAMSKAIDDIDDRVISLGTDVLEIVPQIQAYLDQAEDLYEAMELLSKNPPYIGSNGNWYVWDTQTSAFVDSGVDASITVQIADVTMLNYGESPYITNTGTSTDPIFHLFIPRAAKFVSIQKTGTQGRVDTYSITTEDGATGSFDVTNGNDGRGIVSIQKTGTSGLIDTYTITYSDNTTSTFAVTNGRDGSGSGDMLKADYDNDSTVKNAGGIKAWVQSLGYITGLAWSALTNKPFSTIGSGLTVSNDALKADVQSVTILKSGTAGPTTYNDQKIFVNSVATGGAIVGSRYFESTVKTTSSGVDTFTFTNTEIRTSAVYDFYCDVYGVAPSEVVVSSGTMDVKFNSSDNVTTCRVYIK